MERGGEGVKLEDLKLEAGAVGSFRQKNVRERAVKPRFEAGAGVLEVRRWLCFGSAFVVCGLLVVVKGMQGVARMARGRNGRSGEESTRRRRWR